MKKSIALLTLVLVIIMMGTMVQATTAETLADDLYELGEPYGLTSSDKVRIERYLADYEVTDEQAEEIMAKAEEAVAIMEEAGTTTYSDLTDSQKNELKSIANEAADVLGITLTFSTQQVEMYKDGKLIEVVTLEDGDILAYTGSNTNIVLVVSSIAAIALLAGCTTFVARKRFANA